MSREILSKSLSKSDIERWLKCTKKLLLIVDDILNVTPPDPYASNKHKVLRFLFMDSRTASYDICVLVESLLNNESHHFSRAIEFSTRLLWENAIDYFYIYESQDAVAERYLDFLEIPNSKGESRRKKKDAFKQKYGNPERDSWSGKSREEKINDGLIKQPKVSKTKAQAEKVKPVFEYLNEHVHGNILVGLYWSFDKHGKFEYEYYSQIASGFLNLWHFYLLSDAFCKLTGRGYEIERFDFYDPYVRKLIRKIPGMS